MTNYMRTWVELYPVAATERGIWLLSGTEPWTVRDAVPSDSNPWWEMEHLLRAFRIRPRDTDDLVNAQFTAVANHQTSDRWDSTGQIDTFVSVLPDGTPELWPGARPISLPAVHRMGRPPTHASTDMPETISAAGVLLHALRHLRHLDMFDATAHRDLPPLMRQHLEVLEPALAGLYRDLHQEAA